MTAESGGGSWGHGDPEFSYLLPEWREEKVSDNACQPLVVELVLAKGFLFLWPLDPVLG